MTANAKQKPAKPRPDFPLTAHACGQWCKFIKGKMYYFGPWADPQAALVRYVDSKDDILAGRKPRPAGTDSPRIADLVSRFLAVKSSRVKSGELSQRSYNDYAATCERIKKHFGDRRALSDIRAEDFERLRAAFVAAGWGPKTIGNEINRVRVVFRYGNGCADLCEIPIRFGSDFSRPTQTALRVNRRNRGPRVLDADDLRTVIDAASPVLRAMILLGINCGLGNTDCAELRFEDVNLRKGVLDYPRRKTGIQRVCPLWPETVDAINAAINCRPDSDDERIFLTSRRQPWTPKGGGCPISAEMRKLLKSVGLHRRGLSFYLLRHTFQTIGETLTRDKDAVAAIMGHAPKSDDMSTTYNALAGQSGGYGVTRGRLDAVVAAVRGWLFA